MKYPDTRQFIHRHLPLILFAIPVVTVNSAYVIASAMEVVPGCITYLYGCASISSTGRLMPQKGIFLAGMVPTAILTVLFWMTAERWLAGASVRAGQTDPTLLAVGTTASLFLLVYSVTLGIPGDYYALTRKLAVLIYFGFTIIAQLLLIRRLLYESKRQNNLQLEQLAHRLKYYCALLISFGLIIIPISLIDDPLMRKKIENVIEWNFALLLYLFFLLVYWHWKEQHSAVYTPLNPNR